MATFLTALIWGLGVSLGASIGCMAFVILFGLFKWLTETKAVKRALEINEASIAALTRRNELTSNQIAALERIAEVLEHKAT